MSFVIDASVALKWFLPDEPYEEEALAVVREGARLFAPDLLIAEVCNAAWRSARLGRIAEGQVHEIAAVLPRFFEALVGAAILAPRAVVLAAALDHSVYDCLYLALAEAQEATLVTADARFIGKLDGTPWAAQAMHVADYEVRR